MLTLVGPKIKLSLEKSSQLSWNVLIITMGFTGSIYVCLFKRRFKLSHSSLETEFLI